MQRYISKFALLVVLVGLLFLVGAYGKYGPVHWRSFTGGIFYDKGKVGIGTSEPNDLLELKWEGGVEAYIGRGATDTDITFLMLRNADGEVCYVYPNATQDDIVVSSSKP